MGKIKIKSVQIIPRKLPQEPQFKDEASSKTMIAYSNAVEDFYKLQDLMWDLSSQSGGIKTSGKNIRANQLFTKLTLASLTIKRILPYKHDGCYKWWDVSSFFALSRVFIETAHYYYYMGIEKQTQQEVLYRFKLSQYHNNYEKYRLMKGKGESKELEEGRKILSGQREWLKSQEIFASFGKLIQAKIENGNTAMTKTDSEIAKQFPIDVRFYELIYRLTSNYVHSNPLSFLVLPAL